MTDPHHAPAAGPMPPAGAAGEPAAPPAHLEAEAVRLGRFIPLGMAAGAAAGLVAGALTRRFGVCVPVGIALGVFLAATLPVFRARR